MVIDGRADVVGSQKFLVRSAIQEALAERPPVDLKMSIRRRRDGIDAVVSVELKNQVEASRLVIEAVLHESRLVTDVGRGENGGRTLENDYVVRRMKRIGWVDREPGTRSFECSFSIEPGWNASEVGIVAFLEDPITGRVYGAVSSRSRVALTWTVASGTSCD